MLRQDVASRSGIVVAVLVSLLIVLFSASFDPLLMPLFLLIGAVSLRVYAHRAVKVDPDLSEKEGRSILYYTLIALAGLSLTGVLVQGLYSPPVPSQFVALPTLALVFSALMAVTETLYFQGELLPIFSRKLGFALGLLLTSAVGVAYHMQIYATQPSNLLYVFVGFGLLSWVAWRTKRILPAILAHVINNVGGSFLNPLMVVGLTVIVFVFFVSKKQRGGIGL